MYQVINSNKKIKALYKGLQDHYRKEHKNLYGIEIWKGVVLLKFSNSRSTFLSKKTATQLTNTPTHTIPINTRYINLDAKSDSRSKAKSNELAKDSLQDARMKKIVLKVAGVS